MNKNRLGTIACVIGLAVTPWSGYAEPSLSCQEILKGASCENLDTGTRVFEMCCPGKWVYFTEIQFSEGLSSKQDFALSTIADFLKKAGRSDECIDLRVTGLGGKEVMQVGVVLKKPIPQSKYADLQKALCQEHLGCRVKLKTEPIPITELSMVSEDFDDPGQVVRGSKKQIVKLKTDTSIPQFSQACRTGVYKDAWNDAANTPESRAFLKKLGINIRTSRTLVLSREKTNQDAWAFGFPNHDRDQVLSGGANAAPSSVKVNEGE